MRFLETLDQSAESISLVLSYSGLPAFPSKCSCSHCAGGKIDAVLRIARQVPSNPPLRASARLFPSALDAFRVAFQPHVGGTRSMARAFQFFAVKRQLQFD